MDILHKVSLSQEDIQSIAQLFKVISDPTRLSILLLLQSQSLSVHKITEALNMEQSAVSHQLRILRDNRLVKAKRDKKEMIYSLDDLHVFSLLDQVGKHIQEKDCETK